MIILHDPATLEHNTVELLGSKVIPAHEAPERLHAILEAVKAHDVRLVEFSQYASEEKAKLFKLLSDSHDPGYLHHLRSAYDEWRSMGLIDEGDSILPECFQLPSTSASGRTSQPPKDVFARPGFYAFDMSTGISKGTWPSIEASANLAVKAARLVANDNKLNTVMALCRPPGHHCNTVKAGGYCYVNNAVVAVQGMRQSWPREDGPKIAILDLDFHHGNGTQDYFYSDPTVLYISIHGRDEFPYYSGFEDETGEGEGQGYNLNLPLEAGATLEKYLEKVGVMVDRTLEYAPDFVIVSLGFDTFTLDPLGKFSIETDDYETIAKRIRNGGRLKEAPSAILLEGGYAIEHLGRNLVSFLRGWEGK